MCVHCNLRYVCIIWFVCDVFQLLPIRFTQLGLHYQIYDATYAKTLLKIGPPPNQLWLSEVHVC